MAGLLPDEPGHDDLLAVFHGARLVRGAAVEAAVRHDVVEDQQRAFLARDTRTPARHPLGQIPRDKHLAAVAEYAHARGAFVPL